MKKKRLPNFMVLVDFDGDGKNPLFTRQVLKKEEASLKNSLESL